MKNQLVVIIFCLFCGGHLNGSPQGTWHGEEKSVVLEIYVGIHERNIERLENEIEKLGSRIGELNSYVDPKFLTRNWLTRKIPYFAYPSDQEVVVFVGELESLNVKIKEKEKQLDFLKKSLPGTKILKRFSSYNGSPIKNHEFYNDQKKLSLYTVNGIYRGQDESHKSSGSLCLDFGSTSQQDLEAGKYCIRIKSIDQWEKLEDAFLKKTTNIFQRTGRNNYVDFEDGVIHSQGVFTERETIAIDDEKLSKLVQGQLLPLNKYCNLYPELFHVKIYYSPCVILLSDSERYYWMSARRDAWRAEL